MFCCIWWSQWSHYFCLHFIKNPIKLTLHAKHLLFCWELLFYPEKFVNGILSRGRKLFGSVKIFFTCSICRLSSFIVRLKYDDTDSDQKFSESELNTLIAWNCPRNASFVRGNLQCVGDISPSDKFWSESVSSYLRCTVLSILWKKNPLRINFFRVKP